MFPPKSMSISLLVCLFEFILEFIFEDSFSQQFHVSDVHGDPFHTAPPPQIRQLSVILYRQVYPPSTTMSDPVVYVLASLARYK
jgi:hypothetical protein